jgi:hypothetical protein
MSQEVGYKCHLETLNTFIQAAILLIIKKKILEFTKINLTMLRC